MHTMVKLSYLSVGVFLWCRKQADLEVRERNKEAKNRGGHDIWKVKTARL